MSQLPNFKSEFFTSVNGAVEFLRSESVILDARTCQKCKQLDSMKLVKIIQDGVTKYKYKCSKSNCRKVLSLLGASKFNNTKININEFLLALWLYLLNTKTYVAASILGISKPSYILLKKKLSQYIRDNKLTFTIASSRTYDDERLDVYCLTNSD